MRRVLPIVLLLSACASTPTATKIASPPTPLVIPTTTTTVAPTTTVPATTTTTIDPWAVAYQEAVTNMATVYPMCAEWLPTLLYVGGRLEDWPVWSRVMSVETGRTCDPTVDNGACVGLTQIYYEVHKDWLTDLDITRDDLYDPATNLRFAVMLQNSSGWSPWAYLNME